MKIAFLDIDGVVATERSLMSELGLYFGIKDKELSNRGPEEWCKKTGLPYPDVSMFSWPFDKNAIDHLYQLHQVTKCKFVLSSSWRAGRSLDEINEIMTLKGLRLPFIGMTPWTSKTRGEEIQDWLDGFSTRFPNETLESYVIIDDECNYDIIQTHPNNCVNTRFKTGFSPKHLKKSIEILLKLK